MPSSENYQYVYRYKSNLTNDDIGSNSSHSHESPLDQILNSMKQKYGNTTGALHGAALFDTLGQVSYLPSVTATKSKVKTYHHMPPEQEKSDAGKFVFLENTGSSKNHHEPEKYHIPCALCAGKKHFDPLGEVYYCHRASSIKQQHNTIPTQNQYQSIILRSSTSRLIRSTFPTELDSLLRQDGHMSAKRIFPHVNIQNIASKIARIDGRQKRKFCFSCVSSSSSTNLEAFHMVEDKAATELASFIEVLSHEMTLEEFASAEAEAFKEIFKLIHSTDPVKRMSGVRAVDALILVPSSDEDKKTIKFANNLR